MLRRIVPLLTVLAALVTGPLFAQEAWAPGEYPGLETGKMWTFDQPPLAYWAKRYGFQATPQWLDHARLSSLRMNSGCSASFVSPDGLILTNHHCARACVESSTKPGEDLLGNGFYAPTRADERACQGLTIDQLQEITDVTDSVTRSVPAGATPSVAATKRSEAIARIEERCGKTAPTRPARWSRCIAAGSTCSIGSAASPTSGWSSRWRARPRSSAATRTTSPIPASTSTCRWCGRTSMASRPRPNTSSGPSRAARRRTSSSWWGTQAPPAGSTRCRSWSTCAT